MDIQLPDFRRAQILVIGDVMLDRYWYGGTSRISPEAPVPIVRIKSIEERPGGAGNVALNVSALGSHVHLLGIIGNDDAGLTLKNTFSAAGIHHHLQEATNSPTITKLRVVSRHQQLIRLDFEEATLQFDQAQLLADHEALLPQVNAVILSDYGKGALADIRQVIDYAKSANVPVLVDPKGRDYSIYRGASLLTPNRNEFEMIVGPCPDDETLAAKAYEIINCYELGAMLVTRGEEGMTLILEGRTPLHIPARARDIFDVTGAGDTVIAVLASALASGMPLNEGVYLANLAAGIAVGKLGAAAVTLPELRRELRQERASDSGILSLEQIHLACHDAKHSGERIVFTNGCFDLLHPGHIAYLEEAKALGDRLIVAVNDDDSVRRLKGTGRPINSVHRRMAVLAGIGAVDWVVPFSEDTPRKVIELLQPDVLVKGGDYRIDEVVGADIVRANGGEIKVLSYLQGYSTTDVVERIQQGGDN